jgi:hypothetical protein
MKFINTTLMLFCLSFCLLADQAVAEENNAEYKIKAGYLYNFTKFVTWPKDDSVTFNICIFGQDPFGELIDPIEKRTAFGLPIKLFRFNTPRSIYRCHILFISSDKKEDFFVKGTLVIRDVDKTLSVGEGNSFTEHGGMIGFVNRDGKIKLEINLKALQQSGLTISAKLLEVGVIVGGTSHE